MKHVVIIYETCGKVRKIIDDQKKPSPQKPKHSKNPEMVGKETRHSSGQLDSSNSLEPIHSRLATGPTNSITKIKSMLGNCF